MTADLTVDDFSWDEYFWRADVELSSWAGFQSREGPYGALDAAQPSRGRVKLTYAPEGRGADPLTGPEFEQVAWVLSRERELFDAVTETLVRRYPSLREHYSYVPAAVMPEQVTDADALRPLIGLHGIHVHNILAVGVDPYVGFEFGCEWDDEHGLGVLMCGLRCVDVGGADTAFTKWIADRDLGSESRGECS